MATRTATRVAKEKSAEVKARSNANGDLDREAREMLERKMAGEPEPKKAARTRKPAAPKATTAKPAAKAKAPTNDGIDWTSKAVANRIVKAKQSGKTIKQITEEMGLPAEQRSWFKVSMVWRSEADRLGLDRPRRNRKG